MRDGVELVADHYEPQTSNPAGTLLVRGPYGRMPPFSLLFAGVYASRGYHVIVQSVRGTFGSGGEFNPMVHEIADGADTAAWLRDQPWFTGSFGTIGLSYLGFTQWALLTDPPPEMKAAVITVGPHDVSGPRWGAGSFGLNDFLGWSDMVAHQEDPGRFRALIRQLRARRLLARATAGLPAGEAARALLGTGAPWFESWLEHPEHDDPFWSRLQLHSALDRTEIPVLLIGGWQDLFLEQTLAQYQHLHRRATPVAVTVGPWNHTQLMTKGAPTVIRESLDWLDTHLSGGRGTAAHPGADPRQRSRLDRPAGLAARDARASAIPATGRPPRRRGAARHGAVLDIHVQPGRSDAHRRRSVSGTGERLPQRRPAGATCRRAELHCRRPFA